MQKSKFFLHPVEFSVQLDKIYVKDFFFVHVSNNTVNPQDNPVLRKHCLS